MENFIIMLNFIKYYARITKTALKYYARIYYARIYYARTGKKSEEKLPI